MADLSERYGAFVRYDPRLQRYLDAMPQAIKQMEQSLQDGYQTLHPLFTRMLPPDRLRRQHAATAKVRSSCT